MAPAKYAFYARVLAVLVAIGLPALSVYGIITSPADTDFLGLAAYCFCIGVLVGLLEIPQCCSCNRACVIMAKYLKYVSGYYIARALIYIGSVAGGFAIYALKIKNGNSNFGKDALYLLILLVALTLCAALYIVAVVLRETGPGGESSDAGKGKGGDAAATGFSWPAFGGGGASAAKDAAVRAAAPAVASALLPSLGQRLFGGGSAGGSNGGGDVESMPAQSPGPSAPPAPGPTADSPEDPGSSGSGSNAKGAVFGSSGGLFGGGKNKYGYANDTPEANPFMS